MPVLREDQEKRTGRGRRWLCVLAVPPVLVLVLLLASLVRPVVLPVGGQWLLLATVRASGPSPRQGPSFVHVRPVKVEYFLWELGGRTVQVDRIRSVSFRIGQRVYGAAVIQEQRVK